MQEAFKAALPAQTSPVLLLLMRRGLSDSNSYLNHTSGYFEAGLKADLHKPSKPGGIVISDRLGVTEGFQDCVGFQDLLLDPGGNISSHTETSKY